MFRYLFILLFMLLIATNKLSADYQHAFRVGEQLHFKVYWTVFHAGYSYLRVVRKMRYKGRDALLFVSGARSTGWLGSLFKVRTKITSYWDYKERVTLYSKKDAQEGNYFRKAQVYFDQDKHTANWSLETFSGNRKKLGEVNKNAKWKRKKGMQEKLPHIIQDILSALYFNRSDMRKGKVGDTFSIDVFDDNELAKLNMEIIRKEKIELEINGKEVEIPAFIVRPYLKTTGVFKIKKGSMRIWISDDHRRLPLWIKVEAPVLGHVHVKLYRTVATVPVSEKSVN